MPRKSSPTKSASHVHFLRTNYRRLALYSGLFLAAMGTSYVFFMRIASAEIIFSPQGALDLPDQTDQAVYPTPDPNKNTVTVMLLGYGGAGHQGGFLADVMMLANLDFDTKKLSLISIPRDVWFQNYKLNSLLGLDKKGLRTDRLEAAMTSITGLRIDYYIGIDFVGFQRLVGENLKSITVNVPENFADDWYPIRGEEVNPCGKTPEEITQLTATRSGFALEKEFPCRYERVAFTKGPVKMEGGDALKYVRSRHSSSDFARSERQKVVLLAIRDKLLSLQVFANLDKIYAGLIKNATSNLSLDSLKLLVPFLETVGEMSVQTITLSTENVFSSSTGSSGQFILIPKDSWESVRSYISSQL